MSVNLRMHSKRLLSISCRSCLIIGNYIPFRYVSTIRSVGISEFFECAQNNGILKNTTVVLAVSGGPDSMALAFLASKYFFKGYVHPVIIDHGLRIESTMEASEV